MPLPYRHRCVACSLLALALLVLGGTCPAFGQTPASSPQTEPRSNLSIPPSLRAPATNSLRLRAAYPETSKNAHSEASREAVGSPPSETLPSVTAASHPNVLGWQDRDCVWAPHASCIPHRAHVAAVVDGDPMLPHFPRLAKDDFASPGSETAFGDASQTDDATSRPRAAHVPAILTFKPSASTNRLASGRPSARKIAVLDPETLDSHSEDTANAAPAIDASLPVDESVAIDDLPLELVKPHDHTLCGDADGGTCGDESAVSSGPALVIAPRPIDAKSPSEPPRLHAGSSPNSENKTTKPRRLRTPMDPTKSSDPAADDSPRDTASSDREPNSATPPLKFTNARPAPTAPIVASPRSKGDVVPAPTSQPLRMASPDRSRESAEGMETPLSSDGSVETQRTEPPRRPVLKTADEDLHEYLAEEEPAPSQPSSDRALQGVDAEKAKKPANHGEAAGAGADPRPAALRAVIAGTPDQQRRMKRVQACLDHYLNNPETTAARSPWAVMHAVLAFGSEYELIGPNGRVNAIGWMCHNGLCRTQRMFTPRGASFIPNVGGGVQGHQGQFLAILAQCQVPPDYPIQIGERKFTVEDLVRYEMATCQEKSELTFKLIGLSYYLDSNKQWRANDGKVWSLQKLIQEELAQPVVGAACGGTHRLMGLSFAVKQRVLQGQPIQGQYVRAVKFINDYIDYTWRLQNPDGSFSTNWYEGRGNEPKAERKVQTSGHMLEWLMFTVSDSELRSPRVQKAVDFLLDHIYEKRETKWPIGPRGHATRAIALYAARMSEASDTALEAPNTIAAPTENGGAGGKQSSNASTIQPQLPAVAPRDRQPNSRAPIATRPANPSRKTK